MNDTLRRLRAEFKQTADSEILKEQRKQRDKQRCAAAAVPLFHAFDDIRDEFIRIAVMRQIWPNDYGQRDDRASGLVAEVLGGDQHPCGLRLHIPGGSRRFAVEMSANGSFCYIASRETAGTQPHSMTFSDDAPWLDVFYKTMAGLLEV